MAHQTECTCWGPEQECRVCGGDPSRQPARAVVHESQDYSDVARQERRNERAARRANRKHGPLVSALFLCAVSALTVSWAAVLAGMAWRAFRWAAGV